MRISYRQGLVSAQADFLQIGQVDARYVDLIVSPTPTVVALASGTKDYLISEQRTVTNAWGPFTGSATQYLYWEINPANGQLTRGASTLPVIASATEPPAVNGQMWWDQTANVMKVYNGVRWTNTLRVLAGRLQSGGILIPEPFGSQVGLNTPISAGFILTDGMGAAYKSANGEFLTTDTPLTSVDTGSLVKLDGAQIIVQANENIPKFSLVYLVGGRAALASGIPPENEVKAPIGMVTTDAYQNDAVNVVPSGKVVASEQWDWPANLWGKPVYCGPSGEIITARPPAQKNVRVGTIVGKQSILLMLDWETEVAMSAGGISGVNAISPLTKSGSPDFPSLSIPRSSSVMDGFLSASDFARIPALEAELANKANLNHAHVIGDVTGLAIALANKSDINHTHVIADTTGLQSALDAKAPISHTHLVADITDLAPIIADINSRILNKADKVVGAVAGNFASLDAGGNLNDSGRSPFDYSMVGHTHTIPEITMLQVTLDGKADVVHNHVISQVTGLQSALDGKSDIGHGHIINDIAGLQLALNAKSDIGHTHVIADTIGLQGILDNKANTNHTHIIANIIGLQAELNNKSDIGHTHVIAEITGLQIVLDNKANTNHNHDISDIIGLQAELNNKSDIGHTHIIDDINGLQNELDGKAPVLHMHTLAANLSDVDVITIAPAVNDYLGWDGLHWVPMVVSSPATIQTLGATRDEFGNVSQVTVPLTDRIRFDHMLVREMEPGVSVTPQKIIFNDTAGTIGQFPLEEAIFNVSSQIVFGEGLKASVSGNYSEILTLTGDKTKKFVDVSSLQFVEGFTGTVQIDLTDAENVGCYYINMNGDVTLDFINWPMAGINQPYTTVRVWLNLVEGNIYLPTNAIMGTDNIVYPGTNHVQAYSAGTFVYEFSSSDSGNTILVEQIAAPPKPIPDVPNLRWAPNIDIGNPGDKFGDIAIDANYVYSCLGNYDGETAIWQRTPLVGKELPGAWAV